MVQGPKGCSHLAFSGEKRGLGGMLGCVPSPAGPTAPDPVFFLYQGDRGAPGELGEMGEKVRGRQSGTMPFDSISGSWCPCSPMVAVHRGCCQSPVVLDGIQDWAPKGSGARCSVAWREEGFLKPSSASLCRGTVACRALRVRR